jgi:hypothetical protein
VVKGPELVMDESWLVTRVTVDEAEAKHMVSDDRLGPDPVSFGFTYNDWTALVKQILPGDELWEFCSPPPSWERLAGRQGIVLLRDGNVVASILTAMN